VKRGRASSPRVVEGSKGDIVRPLVSFSERLTELTGNNWNETTWICAPRTHRYMGNEESRIGRSLEHDLLPRWRYYRGRLFLLHSLFRLPRRV